jgi:hypothetical protein
MVGPFLPDANIAPTDMGRVITGDRPNEINQYRFGLVAWSQKIKKADSEMLRLAMTISYPADNGGH